MKAYLQTIGRFLLLLLAIQVLRGLIITGLWKILQPSSDTTWAIMDMIAFGILGVGMLLLFRPSKTELGLEWRTAPRWERVAYIGAGILTLGLVISTYLFQADIFIMNVNSAIVIPVFEELLFRGWGWNQLEKFASFKWSRLINWLVISLLFGLWHFGYMDIYLLKMAPANPGLNWGEFFVMKFITTLILGLVIGVSRGRTGRVYGSIILHALINIFGR